MCNGRAVTGPDVTFFGTYTVAWRRWYSNSVVALTVARGRGELEGGGNRKEGGVYYVCALLRV